LTSLPRWVRRGAPRWAGAAALYLLTAVLAVGGGVLPGRTALPAGVLGLFAPWRASMPPPANPLVGDPVLQFSARIAVKRALDAGRPPLWDPATMAGHPLAGDTHAAPYDPLHLVSALACEPVCAYTLQLVLQLWLAGLLGWAWLLAMARAPAGEPAGAGADGKVGAGVSSEEGAQASAELGEQVSPEEGARTADAAGDGASAMIGGVAWQLAGYHLVFLSFPPFLGTVLWLPGAAAGWEVAVRTGRRWPAVLGGAAAAMSLLAGQLQFAVYGAVVLGGLAAVRMWSFSPLERARAIRAAAVIAAVGLGLAAVHLLPALALAGETTRPAFTWAALRDTAFPVWHLGTLVAPWSLGGPGHGAWRGAQNFSEMTGYVGIVPLVLAAVAVVRRRDARRLALPAIGVWLILLGTPAAWPLTRVPVLNGFGLMRWLAMWPLALAPLVALGAREVLAGARSRRGSGERGHGAWRNAVVAGALCVLVAVDLLAFGRGYTPSADASSAFELVPPLRGLFAERVREPFRVAVFQRGSRIVLGPGVAPAVGLDGIGGYTSSSRGSWRRFVMSLAEPADNGFLRANANMIALGGADPLLLRLLNVRYVLAPEELEAELRPIVRPRGAVVDGVVSSATVGAGECREALVPDGASLERVFWASMDGLNRIDVAVAAGSPPVAVHLALADDRREHLAYAQLGAAEGVREDTPSPARSGSDVPGSDRPGSDGTTGAEVERRSAYLDPISESGGKAFVVWLDRPSGEGQGAPVVCTGSDGGPLVTLWATDRPFEPIDAANGVHVHLVPGALGQAWWVGRARPVADQAAALDLLAAGAVRPEVEVVVEGWDGSVAGAVVAGEAARKDPDRAVRASDELPGEAAATGRGAVLAFLGDGPDKRTADVVAPEGGWLVRSEAWAPGWRARVDGRPAPVLRAFGGLQAVPLPAAEGKVQVDLAYRPAAFTWGLAISAAVLSVGLITVVVDVAWGSYRRPDRLGRPSARGARRRRWWR